MANRLPIGTRVKTIMGVRRIGVIIARFNWRESTDGTYRSHDRTYVPVQWDDGTKGYCYKLHLEAIRIQTNKDGYAVFLKDAQ